MIIRSDQRSILEILKLINRGKIHLDSKTRWEEPRASLLIRATCLLEQQLTNLPHLVATEDKRGNLHVVFGGRSLQTLLDYTKGAFSLNRPQSPDLHNKTFGKLNSHYSDSIEDAQIPIIIVERSSEQELDELRVALNLEE